MVAAAMNAREVLDRTDLAEQAGWTEPPTDWDGLKQMAKGRKVQVQGAGAYTLTSFNLTGESSFTSPEADRVNCIIASPFSSPAKSFACRAGASAARFAPAENGGFDCQITRPW